MPVVPRYGQRQIGRRPLPAARRTAAETELSAGVGLSRERAQTARANAALAAQAFEITASEAITMAREQKRAADEIAFTEASNRFTERINAWQFDPETGAYARRGKDAMDLPNEFADVYSEAANAAGELLKTPEQQRMFAMWVSKQRVTVGAEIQRHVFNQQREYDAAETKASLENVRQSAIAHRNDPRMVGDQLAFGEQILTRWADRNGVGPETLQQAREELRSTVHEGVIMGLLAEGKTRGAKGYFEALSEAGGGQLSAEAQERITKALREGTIREEVQGALEGILNEGGDLATWRKKARERYSGEVEDRVLAQLEHEHNVRDAQRREAIEKIMVDGKNTIEQTGGRWQAIAPGAWTQLSPAQAGALRNYAEMVSAGTPVKTVFAEKYALIKLSADDPGKFAKVNLNEYVDRIGQQDLEQLALMQANVREAIREKSEKPQKQFSGFLTQQSVVNETLTLYGFDPSPEAHSKEAVAVSLVRQAVDSRIQALQQSVQRDATNEEVRSIVQDVLSRDVEVKAALWGTERIKLPHLTAAQIPTSRRGLLERALQAAGRPVDDQSVLAFEIAVRSRLGDAPLGGGGIHQLSRTEVQALAAALSKNKVTPTADAIMQLYLEVLAGGKVQ